MFSTRQYAHSFRFGLDQNLQSLLISTITLMEINALSIDDVTCDLWHHAFDVTG